MERTIQSEVTPERLMQFAFGFAPPLILQAALYHHVFDVLDDGPKTVEQVSTATGASVRGLRAIMDALVSLDFLSKNVGDRYDLTPESAVFLVSTKPTFFGGLLRHTSRQLIPAWLQINEVVRTGRPATPVNQESEGAEFFHDFVEDIFSMSHPAAQALAEVLGLPEAVDPVRVLDIAAGSGVWGIGLAQKSPYVQVTAVDWPGVLPVTRRVAARFGLQDRFTYVSGDVLTADFGGGHQIAVLGHILHSEGEARSRALLRRMFDALAPGGTVVIAEMLANDDRTGPPHALIFAVNMLVNSEHGSTYSFETISEWLDDAGFEDARLAEAPGPSPLILATKPVR